MATPHDLEIPVVVLHADRHVIARFEAGRPQEAAQPVGGGVEFGEGLRESGAAHDERWFVGVGSEMCTREHEAERSRPVPLHSDVDVTLRHD